jgi:hypothetical protein
VFDPYALVPGPDRLGVFQSARTPDEKGKVLVAFSDGSVRLVKR